MNGRTVKKLRQINRKTIVHSYWRNKPWWFPRFLWRVCYYLMFPGLRKRR